MFGVGAESNAHNDFLLVGVLERLGAFDRIIASGAYLSASP